MCTKQGVEGTGTSPHPVLAAAGASELSAGRPALRRSRLGSRTPCPGLTAQRYLGKPGPPLDACVCASHMRVRPRRRGSDGRRRPAAHAALLLTLGSLLL